jgi:diguanylate cyclase (GGDEF)-like protein
MRIDSGLVARARRRRVDGRRGLVLTSILDALPQGQLLPDADWNRRHRWIVCLIVAHAAGLALFGAARGYGVLHSATEGAFVALTAFAATSPRLGRKGRSAAAALGLITSSALAVHLSGGAIEAHFHFFFVLALLTLYQDWLPFLLAIGFVVVHHGTMGAFAPESVYNHPDAVAHPWRWALVHAVFVLATSAANLTAWRVSEQMLHESLTGLPGRAVFLHRLARALDRAARGGSDVAVVFIDLDRFKLLNDTVGHAAGDELLTATAERIVTAVRSQDLVARLGGDEFAVLLEDVAGEEEALRIGTRIQTVLASPLTVRGVGIDPSASIGVAVARPGAATAAELMENADMAMYRAKEQNSEACVVFGEAMREHDRRRLELEAALRGAVERNELRLVYQPILSLPGGELAGVEALVRWEHPTRGTIPPADFISIAEQSGLIVTIGRWILREACFTAARSFTGEGAPYVSVNLSTRQLADPNLVADVERALTDSGLMPQRLFLEITESVLLTDDPRHVQTLVDLQRLGTTIVMDDFGTGYSSLSYLKRLPIGVLKVDRSFVSLLGQDAADESIVGAIVAMARALGIAVVAEGVEREDQLRSLRLLGIGFAQGYLLGRPTEIEHVAAHARAAAPAAAAG